METKTTRVRMAPSPTGVLHVGSLRTAIYDYLLAQRDGGKFILRIEDTDQGRKVEKGNEIIEETFKLYDIQVDEGPGYGGEYGPYIQSERLDLYKDHAYRLVEEDKAYHCFCTSERLNEMRETQRKNSEATMYDRKCRTLTTEEVAEKLAAGEPNVIRIKMPTKGDTVGRDEVMGKVKFKNELIEDTVILKTDGFPTYHLAVVVDDTLMGITHVLRGSEWLSSLPKHIVIYEALGFELPKFAHIPLILNSDGKGKLSKRKGALAAITYLRKGYMRDVMFNYLCLIGWSPSPEDANSEDIYSVEQLIEYFDLSRLQKAGGRYDPKKLDAISGKHIRALSTEELQTHIMKWAEEHVLAEWVSDTVIELADWEVELKEKVGELYPEWQEDTEYFTLTLGLVQERLKHFSELPDLLSFLYTDTLNWTDEDWKFKDRTKDEVAKSLEDILPLLDEAFSAGSPYSHEKWEQTVRGFADEAEWKHGEIFMALRSATTGKLNSPPLLESFEVIGWDKARSFIMQAITWLRS